MIKYIDISGLDKSVVFAALYNRAKPLGMGQLWYEPGDITPEQAAAIDSIR